MPRAYLRGSPGPPYQEAECSVCKTRFLFECDNLSDRKAIQDLKTALLKEWDEHLHKKHSRQWDSKQAKRVRYLVKG